MFDSISSFLPSSHPVQWHCINADSDLRVIDEFISVFRNSVVSLHGASTYDRDIDKDKIYKKWIRNHPHLLQHLVLETDCPRLCPTGLPSSEFNPATGIFLTSKWLENVLRAHGKNVSTIIQLPIAMRSESSDFDFEPPRSFPGPS